MKKKKHTHTHTTRQSKYRFYFKVKNDSNRIISLITFPWRSILIENTQVHRIWTLNVLLQLV